MKVVFHSKKIEEFRDINNVANKIVSVILPISLLTTLIYLFLV